MNELVKMVSQKTGIPEDKAKMAVEVVVGFLKQKMPAPVGEQINAFMTTGKTEGMAEKMKGMVEGVFTKKAG